MNLYIYDYQGQQIGILEETEDHALICYRRWAKCYGKDLGPEPIIWAKCINTVGVGTVIESYSPSGGESGLDAH